MASGKKGGLMKGAATAIAGAVVPAVVDAAVRPETWSRAAALVEQQHIGDKLAHAASKLPLPKRTTPAQVIESQLESVERLISTHSAELSNDAPIEDWQREVSKIRAALELFGKDSGKDRKSKLKRLRERTQKLYNSAFDAALE